jgi:hypothetical protein
MVYTSSDIEMYYDLLLLLGTRSPVSHPCDLWGWNDPPCGLTGAQVMRRALNAKSLILHIVH